MRLNRFRHFSTAIVIPMFLLLAVAHGQTPLTNRSNQIYPTEFRFDSFRFRLPATARPSSLWLMPASHPNINPAVSLLVAAPNLQVFGSGIIGRIPKWTGLTTSNSVIGDSTIFETKFGLVGIGTDNPVDSKLTVLELTPFFSVIRAIKTGESGHGIVAQGGFGSSRISAGSGVVAIAGGFSSGTGGSGLRSFGGDGEEGGLGVSAFGGDGSEFNGGTAVDARGGTGTSVCCAFQGGRGVVASGGEGFNGGHGLVAFGGEGTGGRAGDGVSANGGRIDSGDGGRGVFGLGGFSVSGTGGIGVIASGGETESGTPGIGLLAFGGPSGG